MRHVLNLVALAVILLGVAMIETNGNQWGLAVISVAVVFWLMPLLRLVHKNAVIMVVFWSGVAYFSWQVAVVALLAFFAFTAVFLVVSGDVKLEAPSGVVNTNKKKTISLSRPFPYLRHEIASIG
ncbi:hypothetical protein IO699_002333 [Vibrio parahaemolyticus]|nr:hypothetical protein [Vibrio parahaemolyticus]